MKQVVRVVVVILGALLGGVNFGLVAADIGPEGFARLILAGLCFGAAFVFYHLPHDKEGS